MCTNIIFLLYNIHLQEKEMVDKNSWRKECIKDQKFKELTARNGVLLFKTGRMNNSRRQVLTKTGSNEKNIQ